MEHKEEAHHVQVELE
jgi:hypothetical protein